MEQARYKPPAQKKTGKGHTTAANLVGMGLLLFLLLWSLAALASGGALRLAFGGTAGAGGAVLFSAGVGATAATAVDPAGPAYESLAGLFMLLSQLIAFLPPFFLLKKLGRHVHLAVPLSKSKLPLALLLPLFLGLAVAANSLNSLLQTALRWLFLLPDAPSAAFPASLPGRLVYFVCACIAAAVLEELFFRGAVQGLLRRYGRAFALVSTAVLFTLSHPNLREMLAVFALGLLLGYAAEVSGSILPCMVLHFANNLLYFIFALARESREGTAALALGFWFTLLLVALFVAAVWAVRRFHLGKKLLLPRRAKPARPGGYQLLTAAPVFGLGAVAMVLHYVLQLVV